MGSLNKSKLPRPARGLVLTFYTVFLLWIATQPQPELPWVPLHWDKLRHAGAFFVLTFLTLWSLGYTRFSHPQRVKRILWAVVYALFIGVLIEVLQIGIPGRTADLLDLAADVAGIAAAFPALWTILRLKERVKPTPHGAHQRTV